MRDAERVPEATASVQACYRELHRYKYELMEPYTHHTDICGHAYESRYLRLVADGILEIRGTYAWDGPSGPAPDVPCLMRASLVHDALYQLIRLEKLPFSYRDRADRILQAIARADGLSRPLAALVYWAVRLCGKSCAKPGSESPIKRICVP